MSEIKHGTRYAYMKLGCRCDSCHSAALEHNRAIRARVAAGDVEPREHGYTAYTWGCRCEVCRKAKADYMRDRRASARRRANLVGGEGGYHFVPGITHGRFGYEERGCRCPDCLASRAESGRAQYLRSISGAEAA